LSLHMYHLCCRHIGRSVYIACHDGRKHHGIIKHVDDEKVYLLPYRSESDHGRIFGPVLIGLALGSIAGLALAPRPYPYYPYPPYPYPPYPYPYY
jgi:hypothetical protein